MTDSIITLVLSESHTNDQIGYGRSEVRDLVQQGSVLVRRYNKPLTMSFITLNVWPPLGIAEVSFARIEPELSGTFSSTLPHD